MNFPGTPHAFLAVRLFKAMAPVGFRVQGFRGLGLRGLGV